MHIAVEAAADAPAPAAWATDVPPTKAGGIPWVCSQRITRAFVEILVLLGIELDVAHAVCMYMFNSNERLVNAHSIDGRFIYSV